MAVTPVALSAYAHAAGWVKTESYGDHSDIYAGEELPEIILPRTQQLDDYADVVSQLVGILAEVAEVDETSLYRDLVTADRDVIRIRVNGAEAGSVMVNDGIDLIHGARDMLLATACSLQDPKPLYRPGANKEASDFLEHVHLGQTEHGSFGLTLLPPVVPPPMPPMQPLLGEDWVSESEPLERRITLRLAEALAATREATEQTVGGASDAFYQAIPAGASANLCEALVKLITPFPTLDISLTWARTRPTKTARNLYNFAKADASILQEAARLFRGREPQFGVKLFGVVERLSREEVETDGTITLRTSIEDQERSVKVVLNRSDYHLAIQAHDEKALIILEGDLEHSGQRWHVLNPHNVKVLSLTRKNNQPHTDEVKSKRQS